MENNKLNINRNRRYEQFCEAELRGGAAKLMIFVQPKS